MLSVANLLWGVYSESVFISLHCIFIIMHVWLLMGCALSIHIYICSDFGVDYYERMNLLFYMEINKAKLQIICLLFLFTI